MCTHMDAIKNNARILRGRGGVALHSMAHELCSDEGAHGNPEGTIVPAMCDFGMQSPGIKW